LRFGERSGADHHDADQHPAGDWDGSGIARAGVFRPGNGLWGLDLNGNLAWDAGTDKSGVFGTAGDTPVVGRW